MKVCGKCGGQMKIGKALQPDSVHKIDKRGQTYTLTGPVKMVRVLKCFNCGHTISWKSDI